jgi:purine-nucleoside phosphorylase
MGCPPWLVLQSAASLNEQRIMAAYAGSVAQFAIAVMADGCARRS